MVDWWLVTILLSCVGVRHVACEERSADSPCFARERLLWIFLYRTFRLHMHWALASFRVTPALRMFVLSAEEGLERG